MIAANNISAFGLDLSNPVAETIPTSFDIQSMIGTSVFVNASITTAFKNLLIRISNDILSPALGVMISTDLRSRVSAMFRSIGFQNNNGNLTFSMSSNSLDRVTAGIINNLVKFPTFAAMASNALRGDSWAKLANDIRAMSGTELKRLYVISVFYKKQSLSDSTPFQNENNLLNNLDQALRFTEIWINQNGDPVMPQIRICNNSDLVVQFRIKVEYKKYVTSSSDDKGGFGDAEPYDINNDGNILSTENIYLNRRFLDYFPNQSNAQFVSGDILTRQLNAGGCWDFDFDSRLRGGEATIEYLTAAPGSSAWNIDNLDYFHFSIRGLNPTYLQVLNYINSHNYLTRFWFFIRFIRQESGSYEGNRNLEIGTDYKFQHFNKARTGATYSINKTNSVGLPNFGIPRGYGLGQIDNFDDATTSQVVTPPPVGDTVVVNIGTQQATVDHFRKIVASDEEVWNWKSNIEAAVTLLATKKIPAVKNKISNIRTAVMNWNSAHPTDKVEVPAPINYQTVQYAWVDSDITEFIPYNNLFNEGITPSFPLPGDRIVRSFFDAMLIKSYNGNSGGGFFMDMIVQSTGKPKIVFHLLNNNGDNYVELVSNRND